MMRCVALLAGLLFCFAQSALGDELSDAAIDAQIANVRVSENANRDQTLRTLALEQAKRNQPLSSLKTLGFIRDPKELVQGIAELQQWKDARNSNASLFSDSRLDPPKVRTPLASASSSSLDSSGPAPARGGLGGAGLADFSSLMELIQTTVVPDTWEALGGPSTMSPYPGGILVDGSGLVSERMEKVNDASFDNIAVMLNSQSSRPDAASDTLAWRQASVYRCVSLKRLAEEVIRRRISGKPIDDSIRHLAGLSCVQFVMIDHANRDVILAGAVGGIETHRGWYRDQKSGLTPLRLEYFTAAAASILAGEPFGCTIDPTQQSLAAAAETSNQIRDQKIPVGLAAEALQKALGKQDVRVFGTAGDTPLGHLMVEADRHMKQLALGLQPMPKEVPNYLDFVTRHIAEGPPNGQLLRLWFTGTPMAIRVDPSGSVYEMAGQAMKLASETKVARADGGRAAAPADVRIEEFVASFNENFIDIMAEYPVYGSLHSVYASAAVAELLRRSEAVSWMPSLVGAMLLDDPSDGRLQTPRNVESIATLHRVVKGGKRHSIIIASGGVLIDTWETVASTYRSYPNLSSTRERLLSDQPSVTDAIGAWWWNVK